MIDLIPNPGDVALGRGVEGAVLPELGQSDVGLDVTPVDTRGAFGNVGQYGIRDRLLNG